MKLYSNERDTIYFQVGKTWYAIYNNLIGILPYQEIFGMPMDYQSGHIRVKLEKIPDDVYHAEFKEIHI